MTYAELAKCYIAKINPRWSTVQNMVYASNVGRYIAFARVHEGLDFLEWTRLENELHKAIRSVYSEPMAVDASSPKEQLLKARKAFQDATSELKEFAYSDGDLWNEILADDGTYPFARCFTEVARDIRLWGDLDDGL